MDNVLVTGASGFIGKCLAISLANSGTRVHALLRKSSNAEGLHHPNITIFQGDVLDIGSVNKAMRDCSKAFHLAGIAKMWMKDKQAYFDVNVTGTENVLTAASGLGIEKVVVVSTAGILPPANAQPTNELSPRRTRLHTEYERTKNKAEESAIAYFHRGLPVVIAYPTKVFGPGPIDDSNTATLMIRDYLNGKWKIIPGDGNGTMNYVHVDDVVNGLTAMMETAPVGSRYILGGENASYDQFFSLLREVTGARHRLYHLPYSIIRSIAWIEDARTRVFRVRPLITSEWVKKLPYDWSKDPSKAINELNYRPMTLRHAMLKTIDWLHETKQVKIDYRPQSDIVLDKSNQRTY